MAPFPSADNPTGDKVITPSGGDTIFIGTRPGPDELLNATAVRSICVRNDADLETRINASMDAKLQEQQAANHALVGDVQTLRRDMNRLLEQMSSLTAAMPQSQPPAVNQAPAPPDVVEVRDTQAPGDDRAMPPPEAGRTAAAAAQPQPAETSGLTELMDRLNRLEKGQSDNTGNGDSKRSKKGTKSRKHGKSRASRRGRRQRDDDPSSSSPSSSSSDESSESEDDSLRRRRRRSPVSGAKRFRERGTRYEDLAPLKATNPLYAELLNYRHYRLKRTSRRRSKDTAKARHQVKNMGLTLLPHRFTGENPIMVLDFLRRFVSEAEQLAMSEEQAYIALPFFLKGAAKSHFESVMDTTSEGEGGVTCWPEAVQFLLRSFATANNIRAAVLALRDVRQYPQEDEQTYSGRLAKAEVRRGNIHTQDEKKTLFIDGLLPATKAIISRHRETHDDETYLELLQHAQAEGDTYRARTREDRRPPQLSLVASAKVPRAAKPGAKSSRDDVMFADPFDGFRFRTGDPWGHASQGDA